MSNRGRKASAIRPTEPKKLEGTPDAPRQSRIEITLNGVRVEVSPELEAAVHRACKGLLQPLPAEMTTTQAAEFLDVSRPFIIKLVQRKELPCRMVGKHRRIPIDALLMYREKMFRQATIAADEMAHLSQKMGLYDTEEPPSTKAP